MTDTPELLRAHHLKTLKLPTFLREYDKLARQCAAEGLDHVRFLARLGVVARIGCQVLTQAFATTTDMLNAA